MTSQVIVPPPVLGNTALMEGQAQSLSCADGQALSARLYGSPAADTAVLIAGALGVPQGYYADFARFLAGADCAVLSFDYRGSGASRPTRQPGRCLRMQDWGEQDIEAGLQYLRAKTKASRIVLVGHSAGAQLPGLAPASESLDALLLVAGSAPHLRHYPWSSRPVLALVWYGLGPLLSCHREDFPTRATGLGSTPVAAGVVAQWSRWARSRDYLFDPRHGLDTGRYRRLQMPLLSLGFRDDRYALRAAVEALLAQYPAAAIERRSLAPAAGQTLGHFGFFRQRQGGSLWPAVRDWLRGAAPTIPSETR